MNVNTHIYVPVLTSFKAPRGRKSTSAVDAAIAILQRKVSGDRNGKVKTSYYISILFRMSNLQVEMFDFCIYHGSFHCRKNQTRIGEERKKTESKSKSYT